MQRQRQLMGEPPPPIAHPSTTTATPTTAMNIQNGNVDAPEDDFAFSIPPGFDEALTSVLDETNQAFSSGGLVLDEGGEDNPVNLSVDSDDIYDMDEPVLDVDINEADFFIPIPRPEPEPVQPLTPEVIFFLLYCVTLKERVSPRVSPTSRVH